MTLSQIGMALGVATLYVVSIYGASLWVAPKANAWLDRDDPRVIRARILVVSLMAVSSLYCFPPPVNWWVLVWNDLARTLLILSPVIFINFSSSSTLPGPTRRQGRRGEKGEGEGEERNSWWLKLLQFFLGGLQADLDCLRRGDLTFWRDLVVGPLAEECVFRLAIGSAILGAGKPTLGQCLIAAVIFSLTHAHPLLVMTVFGRGGRRPAVGPILIQCIFTLLFGLFASTIYGRTRSLVTIVLIHALCNRIGFPEDFELPSSVTSWCILAILMVTSLGMILTLSL